MNPRPKKILWPTDFSELSLEAGQYVRCYREVFEAELHVVHVCHELASPALEVELPTGLELSVSQKNLLEAAQTRLRKTTQEIFGKDLPVVCKPLAGNAWPEVCGYAERAGIDLIIVATHGLTGLRHVVLGSTAERIVQHAPCAVLTVKCFEQAS